MQKWLVTIKRVERRDEFHIHTEYTDIEEAARTARMVAIALKPEPWRVVKVEAVD